MSRIINLQAENVKRLKLVEITPGPDGAMVVVGGDNAQGKTSLLDAIAMCIGGASEIPDQPIRQGASKATIILKTEDLVVTRTFSKSGTQLVVKGADGAPIAKPQELLDRLTNRVSFDPLAFTKMDAKKQAAALQKLVGIDFTALDTEHAAKYSERTAINRDVKNQEARLNGMQRHTDAPKEPVSSEEIMARLEEAQVVNERNADVRLAAKEHEQDVETMGKRADDAKAAADVAAAKYAEAMKNLTAEIDARDKHAQVLKTLADADTAPIMEELKTVEATNRKVSENAAWQTENEKLVTLTRKSAALTARLEQIAGSKAEQLAEAKFPVPGLSFTTDGVTFQDVPFSQASAAEQLRVSVAMGFAMQPLFRVALIRDGSLLDDKSLAMVAALAEEYGGQVWLERVSNGAEVSVVMEEGEVKENRIPDQTRKAAAAKAASKSIDAE